MEKNFLLEVGITNDTEDEILKYILLGLEKSPEKYYIVTPNPEILVYATKHKAFKTILNQARIALCDGIGVILAGKILGKKFRQRVTGVDLMEKLCKEVSASNAANVKKPITVGFLGGGPKIAERTAECLVKKYPGLKVVFVGSEWGEEGFVNKVNSKFKNQKSKLQLKNQNSIPNTKYQILNTIDILFVAFGFPKQEEWMAENLNKLPIRIAIGVGGAFDYMSGNILRAPLLIRLIWFEWLFRLIIQPWRIKRQFALLEFVKLVIRERFQGTPL